MLMRASLKISPAIFIACLLSFFLPFVNVFSGAQRLVNLSGVQLVSRTNFEQPQIFGPSEQRTLTPSPVALCALVFAVAGFALSFLKPSMAVAPAIAASAGVMCLLEVKYQIDLHILSVGQGLLQHRCGTGLFFAILLLILAALWNMYVFNTTTDSGCK